MKLPYKWLVNVLSWWCTECFSSMFVEIRYLSASMKTNRAGCSVEGYSGRKAADVAGYGERAGHVRGAEAAKVTNCNVPANTKRNKYVNVTSKRCFDVIVTCLLRCAFPGRTLDQKLNERLCNTRIQQIKIQPSKNTKSLFYWLRIRKPGSGLKQR